MKGTSKSRQIAGHVHNLSQINSRTANEVAAFAIDAPPAIASDCSSGEDKSWKR
jgi:hypothetical protein